jgi:hypothetical protein
MAIRTIETVVEVDEDRRIVVQLPDDVPVGRHRVVTVLDEAPEKSPSGNAMDWKFPVLPEAQWPADMPLTREEMYDEHGR